MTIDGNLDSVFLIASELERDWSSPITRENIGSAVIDFGQFVARPFYWSCEKLALQVIQPKEDRVFEIFKRCMGALLFATLGVITFLGWAVGGAIRMAGAAIAGVPYSYRKGEGEEKWNHRGFSLLTYNVCMYESGLPMLLGGVMPASHRLDRLAEFIKESNSDVVVLQEMGMGPSQELIEKLKGEYPHFYTYIGNSGAWLQSKIVGPELFIASKAPIVSQPRFVPFADQRASQKLGFICLETPTCWIINAHFPENGQEAALKEIAEEARRLKAETGKPSVLAGDLNYRKEIPEELFHDPKAGDETPTCNNILGYRILGKEDPAVPYEVDDYALIDRASWQEGKMGTEEVKIIEMEEFLDPWKALSDHKPIRVKFWTL